MFFCIDFEATQFSQRIISIGCIAENGATFETLVNPGKVKDKTTKFITKLTGITKEMLKDAPNSDEAFNSLFDFICEQCPNEAPVYYCYGNSDKDFLQHTINHKTDPRAITCAEAIKFLLIDYSQEVKDYFVCPYNISLKKIYNFIQDEDVEQHHDALEDAQMLQLVIEKMKEKCSPEDKIKLDTMPNSSKSGYPDRKRAPAIFLSWNNAKMWNANTLGDEDNWEFKCISCDNNRVKYFDSIDTAALWLIRFFIKGASPKKESCIKEAKAKIKQSIETNKKSYGLTWERKED